MSFISISRERPNTDVLVSSGFITQYMPAANGEYVKLYLYLLQALQLQMDFSLSDMADIFEMTEKDVTRALKYWDSKGVLALTYEGKAISHITLLSPWEQTPGAVPETAATLEGTPVNMEYEPPAAGKEAAPENAVSSFALTPAMIREAEESEGFRNLLNLTNIYFKKPLNSMDYERLIWIYFHLGKDFDACEVLVEYCAEKPKRGKPMRQLENLACRCIEQELHSAKDIRAHLMHEDHCQLVKEALGVSKKVLAATEQRFVRRWFEELGFDEALVKEACARAVRNTETGRFEYTNKVLTSWYEEKIFSMAQVAERDLQFKERKKSHPSKNSPASSRSSNKFNNFEQRETDFDEMEALVFGRTE